MKVVDLADEFSLTTAEAVDACLWAGVPAEDGATDLSSEDTRRVRELLTGWIDEGFSPWRDGGEDGDDRPRRRPARADGDPEEDGGGGRAATATAVATVPRKVSTGPVPTATTRPFAGVPLARLERPGGDLELDPKTAQARRAGWLPAGPNARPRTAPTAMLALALAILSLVVPFAPAVAALLVATMASDRIARSRGWLTGKALVRGARVLAGIGIVVWVAIISWSIAREALERQPTTLVDVQVDTGSIPYAEAKAGDCVRFPSEGVVEDWSLVDCSVQHDAEVTGRLTIEHPPGAPYPGEAPIEKVAAADCDEALDEHLGTLPRNDDLEPAFGYPSAQSWQLLDERTVICLAFRHDGTPLVGSLATTAQ